MHLGSYNIVLFVHTPMKSVACGKLHHCNLPNESSRGLDIGWQYVSGICVLRAHENGFLLS